MGAQGRVGRAMSLAYRVDSGDGNADEHREPRDRAESLDSDTSIEARSSIKVLVDLENSVKKAVRDLSAMQDAHIRRCQSVMDALVYEVQSEVVQCGHAPLSLIPKSRTNETTQSVAQSVVTSIVAPLVPSGIFTPRVSESKSRFPRVNRKAVSQSSYGSCMSRLSRFSGSSSSPAPSSSLQDQLQRVARCQELYGKIRPSSRSTVRATELVPTHFRSISSKMQRRRVLQASRFRWFTESYLFNVVVTFLIVSNAILAGIVADFELKSCMADARCDWIVNDVLVGLEALMTTAFCLELVLRFFVLRVEFFTSSDWKFNVFDMVLVFLSLVDFVFNIYNLSFGRILRLLKIITTLRSLRHLRATIKLQTMVLAILHSLSSLVWASVLLISVTFLFACILAQGITEHLRGGSDDATVDFISVHLGSLSMVMLTLWMCVTGGISWWELERVFLDIGLLMGLLLVIYVCFMSLTLLNIVTGIFVSDAIGTANLDRELAAQLEKQSTEQLVVKLQDVFKEMDTEDQGFVTIRQFKDRVQEDSVRSFFQSLDLNPDDPDKLFRSLALDGTKELDTGEFVVGCMALRDGARAVNLASLSHDNRRMLKKLRTSFQVAHDRLDRIDRTLLTLAHRESVSAPALLRDEFTI